MSNSYCDGSTQISRIIIFTEDKNTDVSNIPCDVITSQKIIINKKQDNEEKRKKYEEQIINEKERNINRKKEIGFVVKEKTSEDKKKYNIDTYYIIINKDGINKQKVKNQIKNAEKKIYIVNLIKSYIVNLIKSKDKDKDKYKKKIFSLNNKDVYSYSQFYNDTEIDNVYSLFDEKMKLLYNFIKKNKFDNIVTLITYIFLYDIHLIEEFPEKYNHTIIKNDDSTDFINFINFMKMYRFDIIDKFFMVDIILKLEKSNKKLTFNFGMLYLIFFYDFLITHYNIFKNNDYDNYYIEIKKYVYQSLITFLSNCLKDYTNISTYDEIIKYLLEDYR